MSSNESNPTNVQNALHDAAVFPGNFNPANGKWEKTSDKSQGLRTKLVFQTGTGKLMAMSSRQAEAEAATKADRTLAIDMAIAGYFNFTSVSS